MPTASRETEQQNPITTQVYSNGWAGKAMLPDKARAQDMADFFCANYPEVHGEELRAHDLERYQTGQQIIEQTQEGNAWLVGERDGRVVGLVKFRPEQRTEYRGEPEILLSWILVDKEARRSGIGSELMTQFERELLAISGATDLRIASVADVLQTNDPSKGLFNHWGYDQLPGKNDTTVLFRKPISPV